MPSLITSKTTGDPYETWTVLTVTFNSEIQLLFPQINSENVKNWVCAACLAIRHWILSSQQTTSGETQQHGLALLRVMSAVQLCSHSSLLNCNKHITKWMIEWHNSYKQLWAYSQKLHHRWLKKNSDSEYGLNESTRQFICEKISGFVGYRSYLPNLALIHPFSMHFQI